MTEVGSEVKVEPRNIHLVKGMSLGRENSVGEKTSDGCDRSVNDSPIPTS